MDASQGRPKNIGCQTLQDYINKLSEHYSASESTNSSWFTRIINDCNKFLPNELRHTPMEDITPEMLQEAINRVCRLGGKRYQSVTSGLRDCFRLATLDDVITVNPALSIHIREVKSTSSLIDKDLYREILTQIHKVPGGYLFGLAGFADSNMGSITTLTFDECDEKHHTLLIHCNRKDKIARIVDPDGIAVLQGALALYHQRMEDPTYAHTNSAHILCTNRFGLPYDRRQINTICELLRDACNSPDVDIPSFRKYIRHRQL